MRIFNFIFITFYNTVIDKSEKSEIKNIYLEYIHKYLAMHTTGSYYECIYPHASLDVVKSKFWYVSLLILESIYLCV